MAKSNRKYTYEEVKKIVEDKGYELITKEYVNINNKFIIVDNIGFYYYTNLDKLFQGKTPLRFHKSNPYTIDNINLWIKLNNLDYKLLSNKYNNNSDYLTFQDLEGYMYSINWSNFQSNPSNILKFNKNNLYTIENIKLWCKLNNKKFELLSNEYTGNDKKLKWKCLKDDCGEIFKTTWANIYRGQNCAVCRGYQVGQTNCLATKNPELAKEWHPTKNKDLTPYDVTCGSNKKVWWKCKKGHEWEATIVSRNNGNGCVFCAGQLPSDSYNLLKINPKLCKEWNYKKNKNNPEDYTPSSGKKVFWKCLECGYEWESSIASRNRGTGCPHCAGQVVTESNNLLKINPELCKEWDYNKNKKLPNEYLPVSGKMVWWICSKCNYKWEASISHRSNGNNCPKCAESKGEKRITQYLNNSDIKFEAQKTFNELIGLGNGLLSYDFYLPQYNLLIEYQGEFHDGSGGKGNYYMKQNLSKQQEHDRRKKEYTLNNGYNFLEIWYWDFDNIEEILSKELNKIKIIA